MLNRLLYHANLPPQRDFVRVDVYAVSTMRFRNRVRMPLTLIPPAVAGMGCVQYAFAALLPLLCSGCVRLRSRLDKANHGLFVVRSFASVCACSLVSA